jgi:hypothetical protein
MYEPAVISALSKFHYAICHGEYSMVFTQHYTLATVIGSAALAHDYIAALCGLAAIYLNAEALAVRVSAVLYLTFAFLVCHWLCSPYFDITKLSYAFYIDLGE